MADASVEVIDGRAVVRVSGSELSEVYVGQAIIAAAEAAEDRDAAELAAASAIAAGRYFPTRAAGETASATGQLFSTDDAGDIVFYRKTGSGSVEIARAVTPARLRSADGADSVGFQFDSTAELRRLKSKLLDNAVSVMDFMSPAEIADARSGVPALDVTHAFQTAFDRARERFRTVFIPDGKYLVGNLKFGTQNTLGQSISPIGLIGESKAGAILKALPGLSGTLLQSWSLSGITMRDFGIDTSGSTAVAWDCRWRPNDPNRAGPSTQCVIRDLLINVHDNFTDGVTAHVNFDDMNDTYPQGVTVRANDGITSYTNCFISMVQSGGLSILRDSYWPGGFLRFGCQVGAIESSWGHGVEFADGCLNHVTYSNGYPYGNPNRKTVFWSKSKVANTGMKGLKIITTEMNSAVPSAGITSYFDLNLFGMLEIENSEFIGLAPNLFAAGMRGDGESPALCKIEGGTHIGLMSFADCPNGSRIEVECEGFRNSATGQMVTKNRGGTFEPIIRGATTIGTYARGNATYAKLVRTNNIANFKLRIDWTAHTAPGTESAIVTGFPLERDLEGIEGATLEFSDPSFAGARASFSGNQISFYKPDNSLVMLPASGSVIISGFYSVKA